MEMNSIDFAYDHCIAIQFILGGGFKNKTHSLCMGDVEKLGTTEKGTSKTQFPQKICS